MSFKYTWKVHIWNSFADWFTGAKHTAQLMSITWLDKLLDPRYKTIGFFSPPRANEALKTPTSECANKIKATLSQPPPAAACSSQDVVNETPGNYVCALFKHQFELMMTLSDLICECFSENKLWRHLDATVMAPQRNHNVTADASVGDTVQWYMSEPNIGRMEDPFPY